MSLRQKNGLIWPLELANSAAGYRSLLVLVILRAKERNLDTSKLAKTGLGDTVCLCKHTNLLWLLLLLYPTKVDSKAAASRTRLI